jgi:hypothetical protein
VFARTELAAAHLEDGQLRNAFRVVPTDAGMLDEAVADAM